MAPDLDVLIRSDTDPLLFLDFHRQFSHALVFAPLGALACAGLAFPLARRWLTFAACYLFCLLGYASHGLLDACTSYGTQLFWPFSDARVAWNRVAVVDPLVTLPALALLMLAVVRKQKVWARSALCWVVCYLIVGEFQSRRAEEGARALARTRGHDPAAVLVKPSFGNLLVWKSVYRWRDGYHVDAVRPLRMTTVFPGDRVAALEEDPRWRAPAPGSRQRSDLERFRRFSGGFLALDAGDPNRVIDLRYSMLPNRVDALWGIQLDPAAPQAHVGFVTDRQFSPEQRRALVCMLMRPGLAIRGGLVKTFHPRE